MLDFLNNIGAASDEWSSLFLLDEPPGFKAVDDSREDAQRERTTDGAKCAAMRAR